MQIAKLENIQHYHVRLEPGSNLHQSLRDFLNAESLERAFVLSTIGSVRAAVVNYPVTDTQPPVVECDKLEDLYEINGISGEVWREGEEVRVHLHGSITYRAKTVYGGGLGDAVVFKLAEMVILGIPRQTAV